MNTRHLCKRMLLAMTLFAATVAATDPSSAAAANSDAQAASALHNLAKHLNSAAGIEFAATYSTYGKTGQVTSFSVAGKLAKPNRAEITVAPFAAGGVGQVTPAVIIASDGKFFTAAAPGKSQYVQCDADKTGVDPTSTEANFFVYNVLGGPAIAGEDMAETLLPADFDINDDKVPAGIKRIVTTTTSPAEVSRKQCLDIAQKVVGSRHTSVYHTIIDVSTNSLASLQVYSDDTGTPKLSESVMFSKLATLSATQIQPTEFAYAPSAGMTAYHAAAAPGTQAPDFAVARPDGTSAHLSDYKGKIIVIDFWATWCPPCLATLPSTDKLAAKYEPQGVVFLPICTWDTKERFDAWLPQHAKWKMTWLFDTAALDADKSIATTQYAISAIPAQYVIGKDGTILYRGFADSPAGEKPLIAAIKKAMSAS